jgi:hypothetical protein
MKYTKHIRNIGLFVLVGLLGIGGFVVFAANTQFNQTINPGVLSIGIVDAGYITVGSPAVTFGAVNLSVACQSTTGTLGTSSQQLYIQNPDGADNGWTVSIAGSSATSFWDGTPADYDFNDPSGSGCTDGGDADSLRGQLTVNPSVGTLAIGQCLSCATTNISLGSQAAFSQGTLDSITLLNAAAGSSDIGDWTFQGVSLSQTIPAEQAVASDYDIPMVVSVVAN